MVTIATALQKGGVGKSSIAMALAFALSKKGKTILIDCDPQGNSSGATAINGIINAELADYLFSKCSLLDCIYKTSAENLFIIPTKAISGKDEVNKLRNYVETKAQSERYAFDDMIQLLSSEFQYCVVDTSPSFSSFEKNIFYSCDEVIPVMLLDVFSNDGLGIFKTNLKDFQRQYRCENPKINTVVLNQIDCRIALNKNLLNLWRDNSCNNLIEVPTDQAFKRSQNLKTSVQKVSDVKKETVNAISELANIVSNIGGSK